MTKVKKFHIFKIPYCCFATPAEIACVVLTPGNKMNWSSKVALFLTDCHQRNTEHCNVNQNLQCKVLHDDDDDRRREKGVTLHVEQIVEVVAEWSSEQLKRNFSTSSTATNPAPHNFATAKNLQCEYFCIWSILQKTLSRFTTPQIDDCVSSGIVPVPNFPFAR